MSAWWLIAEDVNSSSSWEESLLEGPANHGNRRGCLRRNPWERSWPWDEEDLVRVFRTCLWFCSSCCLWFLAFIFGTLLSSYICLRVFPPSQTLGLPISQKRKILYCYNFRGYKTLKKSLMKSSPWYKTEVGLLVDGSCICMWFEQFNFKLSQLQESK